MSIDLNKLTEELARVLKAMPGLPGQDRPTTEEEETPGIPDPITIPSSGTNFSQMIGDFQGLNTFLEGLDINSITSGIQNLTSSGALTELSNMMDFDALENGISLPSGTQNIAQVFQQVAQPLISKIDESVSVAPKMIPEMDPTTISTMSDLLDSSVTNGFPNNIVSGGSPGDIAEALTSAVPDITSNEIQSVISGLTHLQTQIPDLQSFVQEYIKEEVFGDMSTEMNSIMGLFQNLVPSVTENPLVDIGIKTDTQSMELFKTLGITDPADQSEIMKLLYNGDTAGAILRMEEMVGDLSESEENAIIAKLDDILGD